MADGMEADDPFASILKFCQPTDSQLAMFPSCPFYRDSDEFQDPDPDPYPGYTEQIVSDALHGSHNSAGNQAEDSAVFHNQPEHHLSSSENQNPNETCAEGVRGVQLGGGADVSEKGKGFEGSLAGEIGSKKTRVPGVELGGDEIRGTDAVDEIIDSGYGDIGEPVENITVDESKMACESSSIAENLDDGEAGDQIDNLRSLFSSKSGEVPRESGISKDGKGNEGSSAARRRIEDIDKFRFTGWDDAARKCKPWKLDVSVPSKRKRKLPATMMEMGKNDGVLVKGKEKEKNDGGTNGAGNELPGSDVAAKSEARKDQLNDEQEKNEGGSNVAGKLEKKGGLYDILGILKTVVRDLNGDKGNDGPVDFLETAKKRGMKFPQPRWRSPEGKKP